MTFTLMQYATLGGLSFLAGFVDSIAGGGGLIAMPAYLSLGIPTHYALGTSKFSSFCGTSLSTVRYFRNGSIDPKVAFFAIIGALIGSPLGARLVLFVDEKILKIILLVVLPIIAVLVLVKKNFGTEDHSGKHSQLKISVLSGTIGLVMGVYDGFFGPGTGTFLMLAFSAILGLPLLKASGNAKIVNLSSNIGALTMFFINGKVLFNLGLVAAAFNTAGNWFGSGMAIKVGPKVIRPVFVFVLVLLLGKIGLDTLGPLFTPH